MCAADREVVVFWLKTDGELSIRRLYRPVFVVKTDICRVYFV